jgi:hypothetical protein
MTLFELLFKTLFYGTETVLEHQFCEAKRSILGASGPGEWFSVDAF